MAPTDDLIFEGRFFSLRAMRRGMRLPAQEWVFDLQKTDLAKVLAKATRVDRCLEFGVPTADTFSSVSPSRAGLVEFRITAKRGRAPHLRMLGLMFHVGPRGTYWAALGFKKQKNKLERKEIDAADHIALGWLEHGGER